VVVNDCGPFASSVSLDLGLGTPRPNYRGCEALWQFAPCEQRRRTNENKIGVGAASDHQPYDQIQL